MIRNYFSDLELGILASEEDVRRAYKRLARKFHPDLNPNDAQAAATFRRIQEAYAALQTTTRIFRVRRQLHEIKDKLRVAEASRQKKWPDIPVMPKSPKEFLQEWKEEKTKPGMLVQSKKEVTQTKSATRTSTKSRVEKNKRPNEELDIRLELYLEKETLKVGGRQRIQYFFEKPCGKCRGSGGSAKSLQVICKNCAGLGVHFIQRGAYQWKKACEPCLGRGFMVVGPCEGCSGRGKSQESQVLNLKLTPPLKYDQVFKVNHLGNISFDGKRRGDIWVSLTRRN